MLPIRISLKVLYPTSSRVVSRYPNMMALITIDIILPWPLVVSNPQSGSSGILVNVNQKSSTQRTAQKPRQRGVHA